MVSTSKCIQMLLCFGNNTCLLSVDVLYVTWLFMQNNFENVQMVFLGTY